MNCRTLLCVSLVGIVVFTTSFDTQAQNTTTSTLVEKGGTLYLNDPEILSERPMLLPTPTPTPTPTPRPKATPRPTPRTSADQEATEHIPAGSLRATRFTEPSRALPATTVRRSSRDTILVAPQTTGSGLTVETTVPYPTQYAPPRVSTSWGGPSVVVPATPTRFATTGVGTRFGSDGFQSREFEGFINYGSPIRTIAPVYDSRGRPVGYQVFETPNPVLQPVFRTIEIRR